MNELIARKGLSIRLIEENNEGYLLKWLTNDVVLAFYEGRDRSYTLEKVREGFYNDDNETRCLIFYNEKPIGYVQFYVMSDLNGMTFPARTYGMDQFIGEPEYWNKGLGTRLVQMVVNYLVNKLGSYLIVMDPQHWNKRAIHCYEKVGFKQKCVLPQHEWHEGRKRDCILMTFDASEIHIQPIGENRLELKKLMSDLWGSSEMVLSSGVYRWEDLDGFVARNSEEDIIGLVTHCFHSDCCEIVSLDSFTENTGVGSRLLVEVEMAVMRKGLSRITLLTTNDNLHAIRFYQRKGYRLNEVISGAVDEARKRKPEIPVIGHYQIPIHDELKLIKLLEREESIVEL
ncbi:GNAT family N-acetyltransferase [Pseudalkalibacillus hwajinpoensis]|uniref:GNAT family N-acetyltransferase n=1 Tax=Guptibacillus hwajinpoensis TaxID=208199 RepID=UPI00325C07D9